VPLDQRLTLHTKSVAPYRFEPAATG
jgi:hypothetical protein